MPCVVACGMMSYAHHMEHTCRLAGHPYDFMAQHNSIICLPFSQVEGLLLKLAASDFNALSSKNINENMLERILIAMQDENKTDCNENFRICSEDSVDCLYKW